MASIKKIGFNGRPFCQEGFRGLSRHTLELILNIHAEHPEIEIYIYSYDRVSDFYKHRLPFAHFRDKKASPKFLWDLYFLGKDIRRDGLDLYHSTNNLGVPLLLKRNIKLFTTIHDHFTHLARMPWGRGLRSLWSALNYRLEFLLLKRSDFFFTVSADARTKISSYMGIAESKIEVAYNGSSLRPGSAVAPDGNFYLYVGGLEERKNISLLLSAFAEFAVHKPLPPKLILAGSIRLASEEVRQKLQANPTIFEVREGISDDELSKLYQASQALIFPSLEEGFGLPLVEAMSLGCPVIASNINVFKEIGADTIRYFDVRDKSSLVSVLLSFEEDRYNRSLQVEKAFERSKLFTWPKMAQKIFSTYVRESRIDL